MPFTENKCASSSFYRYLQQTVPSYGSSNIAPLHGYMKPQSQQAILLHAASFSISERQDSIDPSGLVPFDELQNVQVKDSKGTRYRCPVCLKESKDKTDFRKHYRVHTGEKPYECSYCPYRATQASSIKLHIGRSHQNRF